MTITEIHFLDKLSNPSSSDPQQCLTSNRPKLEHIVQICAANWNGLLPRECLLDKTHNTNDGTSIMILTFLINRLRSWILAYDRKLARGDSIISNFYISHLVSSLTHCESCLMLLFDIVVVKSFAGKGKTLRVTVQEKFLKIFIENKGGLSVRRFCNNWKLKYWPMSRL